MESLVLLNMAESDRNETENNNRKKHCHSDYILSWAQVQTFHVTDVIFCMLQVPQMEMMSLWSFPMLSPCSSLIQHQCLFYSIHTCPSFFFFFPFDSLWPPVARACDRCAFQLKHWTMKLQNKHCFDFKGLLTGPRPERTLPEGSPRSRPIKPRDRCFQGGTLYLSIPFYFWRKPLENL